MFQTSHLPISIMSSRPLSYRGVAPYESDLADLCDTLAAPVNTTGAASGSGFNPVVIFPFEESYLLRCDTV
jgi:hypothetical protein